MEYLNVVVDIVKEIVDNKEAVTCETTTDDMGVLLTIDCATADKGKIIGREGRTASVIRDVARILGAKNKAHVSVKIKS